MASVTYCPICYVFNLEPLDSSSTMQVQNVSPRLHMQKCEKCSHLNSPAEHASDLHHQRNHVVTNSNTKNYSCSELLRNISKVVAQFHQNLQTPIEKEPQIASSASMKQVDSEAVKVLENKPQTPCFVHAYSAFKRYVKPTVIFPLSKELFPPLVQNHNLIEPMTRKERGNIIRKERGKTKVACEICHKLVPNRRLSKVYHSNKKHANFPLYKCSFCDVVYTGLDKASMAKHIERVHKKKNEADLKNYEDNRDKYRKELNLVFDKCFPYHRGIDRRYGFI
ncbi:unnamed protein product [Caenorhabditis brenneri]